MIVLDSSEAKGRGKNWSFRLRRILLNSLHAALTLRKSVGLSRAAHQIRPAIGDPVHDRDRNVPVSPII